MSGGFLGLSGFNVPRLDSTTQTSGAEYANQANGVQQSYADQIAALAKPLTANAYAQSLMAPVAQNYANLYANAGFNLGPDQAAVTQNALMNDFVNGSLEQAYASVGGKDNWDSWNTYYHKGAAQAQDAYGQQVSGINAQAAAAAAKAAKAEQARQQNQQLQQQAYNQQTGGGFTGGILNDSYAKPFSNVLGANGFSSGMMGQGTTNLGMGAGTTAAPSTGLTPFGAPAASTGQQTGTAQGWGGPFSAKNPWSLT